MGDGLGAFMEALGCRAVPSNSPQEDPKKGDYYGGAKPDKIIFRYGSRNDCGQVDAIQVEMQKDVRKDEVITFYKIRSMKSSPKSLEKPFLISSSTTTPSKLD